MKMSRIFPMLFANAMAGGTDAKMGEKPPATLHRHGSFHKVGKFKGWMRENRRCSFKKNK